MWKSIKCGLNLKGLFLSSLVLLLFLLPQISLAADYGCGHDTDRNNSVDNWCGGLDADEDGYVSVANGCAAPNCDCDDNNWQVYPGISTEGASANTFKTCQSDGTFTTSAANSTYTCHSTGGVTYWANAAETDCSGAGTFGDPEDYRCFFNTAMFGYHQLTDDDCLAFQGGTYTAVWGAAPQRMIYQYGISGTAGNEVHIEAEPGLQVVIDSPGVPPNKIVPIEFESSNRIFIKGNAVGMKGGLAVGNGFTSAGVYLHGSDNSKIETVYSWDNDGACGTDNCGGIKIDDNSDNVIVRANLVFDTYNRSAPTNGNNNNFDVFRGNGNQFLHNSSGFSNTSVGFHHFNYKHCETSGTAIWTYAHNQHTGGAGSGLASSCGGASIHDNLFLNLLTGRQGILFEGGNGATYFAAPSTIENNTIPKGKCIEMFTSESDQNSNTFGLATVRKNICQDDAASYPASDSFFRVAHYGADTMFTALITGGKITFIDNDYYNSVGTALNGSIFGCNTPGSGCDNGLVSGTTQANFAAWQAAGLSTTELNIDPLLNDDYVATAGGTTTWGWRANAGAVPTPTPTPPPQPQGGYLPFM